MRTMMDVTTRLADAARRLANEAGGFLSMADRYTHGNTNIRILQMRIGEMEEALAAYDGQALPLDVRRITCQKGKTHYHVGEGRDLPCTAEQSQRGEGRDLMLFVTSLSDRLAEIAPQVYECQTHGLKWAHVEPSDWQIVFQINKTLRAYLQAHPPAPGHIYADMCSYPECACCCGAQSEVTELRRQQKESWDIVVGNPITCVNGIVHDPTRPNDCFYCAHEKEVQAAREAGATQILESVRASLRGYPQAGCDAQIGELVDGLLDAAFVLDDDELTFVEHVIRRHPKGCAVVEDIPGLQKRIQARFTEALKRRKEPTDAP